MPPLFFGTKAQHMRSFGLFFTCLIFFAGSVHAGTKTWDGRYSTEQIELTVVYFVPADRNPLADWRDRVDYYCRRIEKFHAREFGEQSTLTTKVINRPFTSSQTTAKLRQGDANSIYYKTLSEVDRGIQFQTKPESGAFPILLVLSEINWRPLDDFYRLRPSEQGFEFEGNYQRGEHFPGATSGGARASYIANRGCGWGLVSADGWRVPYRGSDCVIYHEGCGHTVGLPHPEPGNGSVMSLGQYRGWISESWLDDDQKERLNWQAEFDRQQRPSDLFSTFRAIPNPREPKPNQNISLELDWPVGSKVKSLRVRYQTAVHGPWSEVPTSWEGDTPSKIDLGSFDRATPISYRVDVELDSGESEEIWGYLQIRTERNLTPQPKILSPDLLVSQSNNQGSLKKIDPSKTINLLQKISIEDCWSVGTWTRDGQSLLSPKQYGARLELPATDYDSYQLNLLVEPLDAPNSLLIGNRHQSNRFATTFGFLTNDGFLSAIENINGRNIGNETTHQGQLFKKDQISQVIIEVHAGRVLMMVDGTLIVDWKGDPSELSLSDYWSTPNPNALSLGTYDCRFKFHQILITPF